MPKTNSSQNTVLILCNHLICERRHDFISSLLFLLLARFLSFSLLVTLGVDGGREVVFVAQRDLVYNIYPRSQHKSSGLAKQQRSAQEAQGRSCVHWRASHVEGETSHHFVKQDAKVVAQESSSDTQSVSRTDDQEVTKGKQGVASELELLAS